MPRLTPPERDAFLDEPGILCRIATVRPDGSPHVTPIWYLYEDAKIYMTPRKESTWLSDIRRDPRIAITIDEQPGPYRKVLLQGAAVIDFDLGRDDEWRHIYRRIARRYVPAEGAEHYIQETIDQTRALISLSLADAKVQTWRMPIAGEPYAGIWHDRYYAEGTKLKRGE
jgi:PPOX class probable F420-dependent enzyme